MSFWQAFRHAYARAALFVVVIFSGIFAAYLLLAVFGIVSGAIAESHFDVFLVSLDDALRAITRIVMGAPIFRAAPLLLVFVASGLAALLPHMRLASRLALLLINSALFAGLTMWVAGSAAADHALIGAQAFGAALAFSLVVWLLGSAGRKPPIAET